MAIGKTTEHVPSARERIRRIANCESRIAAERSEAGRAKRGHLLSRFILRLFGWKVAGALPAAKKWVVVGAPHTSNWDFPLAMLAARAFRIRISWIGKAGLFRFPFGWFMRWLGGIPAERTGHDGLVSVMAARFAEVDRLILAIAPEGTRKSVPHWRSGFYRIARGAGVPIVPAVIDAERKEVRLGEPIMPTGNVRADMDRLRAFYSGVVGVKPEGIGPVLLQDE